ncbi:MAG: phosphoadenosine phosphosulfate reductase family protein [Bacteroidales bacterium]
MGVRAEESLKRAQRGEINVFGSSKRAHAKKKKLIETFSTDSEIKCVAGKEKINIYPIFNLTEKEIFSIIKTENLKIPDIYYTKKRTGCAFCPFSSTKENFQTLKSHRAITKKWLETLDTETFMTMPLFLGADNILLFYLYITHLIYYKVDIQRVIRNIYTKDLFASSDYKEFLNLLK